jgi:four helix bundle protein
MTNSERTREHDDAFWLDGETLIVREEPRANPVYDLEERTARFGEAVIDFAKKIPGDPVTERIITQLIGAGTSVGANYTEADDSVSKREFLKCIATCKKEARETKFFLRMFVRHSSKTKTRSARTVDGSQRVAPDLRENLANRKTRRMTKQIRMTNDESRCVSDIRISSFLRHSSFVLRHSPAFPVCHSSFF